MKKKEMKKGKKKADSEPVDDVRNSEVRCKEPGPYVADNFKEEKKAEENPGELLTNNKVESKVKGSTSAGVQKDENLKDGNGGICSGSQNNVECRDPGSSEGVSDVEIASGEEGEDDKDVCTVYENFPPSLANVSEHDFEVIQCEEEINFDNLQPNSGHKQRLQPGRHSRQSCSRKIQSSGSAEQQGSEKRLSFATDCSDEQYFHCDDNRDSLLRNKEIKQSSSKVDRSSISCENDSDLESIPTVSDFKQRAWIGRRFDEQPAIDSSETRQSSFGENRKTKRSFDKNGYIDGKWQGNRLIDLHSCEFTHPYDNKRVYIRKQRPGYLFTFDDDDFIARARFDKLEELDFSGHPTRIKRCFLDKLTITKVIEDKLSSDCNDIYSHFIELLRNRSCETAGNLDWAEDIFQLSLILDKHSSRSSNTSILQDITENGKISSEMKDSSRQLISKERIADSRRLNFPQIGQFDRKNLLKELRRICEDGVIKHRNVISTMAPFSLEDHINALQDKLVPYITKKDMELFADLAGMMSEEPYLDFVNNLWDAYFEKIKQIGGHRQVSSLRDFLPSTHPIYFYLCKSFQELVAEIGSKADLSATDLLKSKNTEWSLPKVINWPSTSRLTQSLEQQYRFIFKAMQHFKPGYYSDKAEFNETLMQRTKNFFSNIFSSKEESSPIPIERSVWIRIFENAIHKIFSEEELKLFEPLLNGYTDFVTKAKSDQYESFRIVMHSTIRFIAQTCPYLSNNVSEIDRATLMKQIDFINKTISTISDEQFNDFRDLINVYNEYWKNRETIIEQIADKFPFGKFKTDMQSIRQKLHDIVNIALSIAAKPQGLITYFRSFNEFLEDLAAVEYSWFVKEISNASQEEVKLINKNKRSYQILDPEKFIEKDLPVPRHYVIEIIQDLLSKAIGLLERGKWSNDENLNAASVLLVAISKSFLYLKDQPNYVSFDTFKEESTMPFASAIANSNAYEDFEKRIGIIGESFWYLRKQDEIDIELALNLYEQSNDNSIQEAKEILKNCYTTYLNKFDSYVENICDKNYGDKIKFITEELIPEFKLMHVNKWEQQFKKETVPLLLAGLAAVWSVQASKDIATTGKSLKPHCIQILCILRLLSVDNDSDGVDKHLAQVLTGQGKSLVLGLLSALLALLGHRVRIVCYSDYLASRDQQDFNNFFNIFRICDNITYGTFEDMANEMLRPEINGKKQGLRQLVIDRVLNHSTTKSGQVMQDDINNTILLIDEVDVFFTDRFYGNTYSAVCRIPIPALAIIQEKIWESVSRNDEISTVLTEVGEFVKKKIEERTEEFRQFNKFLSKPGNYYLLIDQDNVILRKEYTNRSLYEEHLDTMVKDAKNVAKGHDENWYISRYKINDDGFICYRNHDGLYDVNTLNSYYNVFYYFRLKKKDYHHKYYLNYGYLILDSGKIAYAKLPEKYPLILGVTGTLTALNYYEKKAIRESYNINRKSIMPSYFGQSNLEFDKNKDVLFHDWVEDWRAKIFSRANSKIVSGRSVLIFFDTDKDIDEFKSRFFGRFDRLHVLTENTGQRCKKKYIDEAGIAKTITIATRGMGRGIDFKSSVAVERNHGVHVIQTFFSLDIKEETQIKGRTARKDNQGSYELILCTKHLIRDGFLKEEEVGGPMNYESLNRVRSIMVDQIGSNNETRIKKSEDNHKTTMDFLESFFERKKLLQITSGTPRFPEFWDTPYTTTSAYCGFRSDRVTLIFPLLARHAIPVTKLHIVSGNRNPIPLPQCPDKDGRHSGQSIHSQQINGSGKGTSSSADVEQAIKRLNSWKAWIGSEPWLADAARELYERSRKLRFDIRKNAGCWSYSEYCERLAYHYYNLACYYNDELLKKHKICLGSVRRSLENCLEKLSEVSRGAGSNATNDLRNDAERFLTEANEVYKQRNNLLTKYGCSDAEKYTKLCIAFGNIGQVPLQQCSLRDRKSLEQRLQNIQLLNVIDTLENAITLPEYKNTLITAQRSNCLGQAYQLAGLLTLSSHYAKTYEDLVKKLRNLGENAYVDEKEQVKDIIVTEIAEYSSSLAQVKDYVREAFHKLSFIDEAYIERKYVECCSTFWITEMKDAFKELADHKSIGVIREVFGSLDSIEGFEDVPDPFKQLRCHRLLTDPHKLVSKEDEKALISRFKEECRERVVGCVDSAKIELDFLDALLHLLSTSENRQSVIAELELEEFRRGELSFDQLLKGIIALDAATYGAGLAALQEAAGCLQRQQDIFLADELREVICAYTAPTTIRVTKLDGRLVAQVTGRNIVVSEILFELENEFSANSDIEEVHFIGGDAVHIDADLRNEAWHGKNLVILTKTIKVHGSVSCDVSGKDSDHSYGEGDASNAGTGKDGHGKEGKDGYAGESGGNVSILTGNIENLENFTVISNGGKGSNGQDGGNGKDGENGKSITNVDFSNKFPLISTFGQRRRCELVATVVRSMAEDLSSARTVWVNGNYKTFGELQSYVNSSLKTVYGNRNMFVRTETNGGCKITLSVSKGPAFPYVDSFLLYEGSQGQPGGRAGGPGLGGEGGHAGEIITRNQENGQDLNIVRNAKHGEGGKNGKGGRPGIPGKNGCDMGYMHSSNSNVLTFLVSRVIRSQWQKYFGTDGNSKCKLIYYNESNKEQVWCEYEKKYVRIEAAQIENRSQRECDRQTETRQNSDRRHHARATRKKNISQDSILDTYSDRLSSVERDTLQSLRSDLGSAKQQALRAIDENQEQQKKQSMELGIKRHVNFAGRGTNNRRTGSAPSAAYKEAPNVVDLIDKLNREPHSVDNWLELRGTELNRSALDGLFSMFDTVKRGLNGKRDRWGIKELLIEKYRLATLEEIAKQLPVYQEIADDVELTPESAARYLVEDKQKRDSPPHPALGAIGQYLYEDNKEQRERISKFCQEISQSNDGNRETLRRSLAVFIVETGKEACAEQSDLSIESAKKRSPSEEEARKDESLITFNDRDKQLLKEYRDHIQDEGPLSESYRVLLAYAFGINIRLYVENERKKLSLEENHNPSSDEVVRVLQISDGFVQLKIDDDYFRLVESCKMGDDLYGRILATIDTFKRKEEFDDYLAKQGFLSSRGKERPDQSARNEQQDIIDIAECFPTEKGQLTRRLEVMASRYTGEQGILRNISKRFSAGGSHVSSLELYCLLNSILRCVIDEQGLNTFRWIVAAHPQSNWIDELILVQLENYFRRLLPEKPKWREYLSRIVNKDILLSFHVKLDLCAPGSSISAECIDNILYLLSNVADEAVGLEGLGLSEWPYALKEKYWSCRLSQLANWRASEMLSTACYHLLSVENASGTALVKEFLDILKRKTPELSVDDIIGFLANFNNEKWNLSRETLTMLERCNVAEWARRMQRKFVADGKDRDVTQLVKLIEADANSSTGITEKLTDIGNRVRSISEGNYAIAGGKSVDSYTEHDIRNSLNRFRSDVDKIEAKTAMEMLAVIVRAIELKRGFKLRDTQKLTVLALLANDRTLAQVSTGEGKSLIVVAASIMKALCRKKVDIITSSSVLAKRDAEENSDIYGLFDVNVSHNCSEDIGERKKAYSGNQVVYGDLANFQRDYLLDKFYGRNVLGDRNFENVIVDEVDSMLLDKGNNVLYLSHDLTDFDKLESVYIYIWQWINRPAESIAEFRHAFDGEAIKEAVLDDLFGLVRCEDIGRLGPDLKARHRKIIWERLVTAEILNDQGKLLIENVGKDRLAAIIGPEFSDYRDRLCHLLKETAEREKLIKVPNHLRPFIERHLESWIKSAIQAFLMKADQDYVVDVDRTGTSQDRDPNVTIVDRDTGTDQANSQWDEALHQFLQLKHGCKLSLHSLKAVFVSNVSFLKLYRNLYGLTGTLGTPSERALLKEIHGVDFVTIPTARSKQFHEDKALLCADQEEWKDRIRQEARKRVEKRSVLIICETVNEVEVLRSAFREGDAKSVRTYTRDYEKFDAARDGERLGSGHIIIATNLAGRGTDIKITKALGEAGGLHVCLTYLPTNIRIEQQAFGRAARSGDKGTGQLIVIAAQGREYSNSKVVDLKMKRDADELRRISDIKHHYKTQITVEENCFEAFRDQYERLKKNLDDDDTPGEVKEILLQSCLDKWAFWLDENNKRIKDLVNQRNVRSFYELLNEFISKLKRLEHFGGNWSSWVRGNPVQTIKLGKYFCQHKSLDVAVKLFDHVIQQEPEFSEAAHYYKALALAKGTDKAALQMAKKELREAGRLFDERSMTAMTVAAVIGKIKKSNNDSIIQIDAYEKQQKSLCNLYYVFMQSIDDILGHGVTPRSFVNDNIKEDLAEVLYEDLLRQGTLAKPRIKEDVSDEELEKICSGYGTPAKTLKDFLSVYAWRPIDEEAFLKALQDRMRLPSRGEFWRSLIDKQVLGDEVKYVTVEKSIETDPLWSDISTVAERLEKHSLEPESDNGEVFLYAERIAQHKSNAHVFKKDDFVKAVGSVKYRTLKKKGLLSLNRKARVDRDRIESVGFTRCDSIALENFEEVGIARNEAERILEELVKQDAVEKKDCSEGGVYGLKVQFDEINGVQLPFCPAYENAVRGLLRMRFAYRIALQKIAKQLKEKDFPVRVYLTSKPHQGLASELLQKGIIVPATVTAGDLDDNVRSLYELPATEDNLRGMLSRSIPIPSEQKEALFHQLVDKGWILVSNPARLVEEKGVQVVTEISKTVETTAVSLVKDLYFINGSDKGRKPLDSSYKDFESSIRRILDRRLVLAKEDTMKTVTSTLESLRSVLISLDVPSIKLKSLAELSGEGVFANIEEMRVFFLNGLDDVLKFEEKRWSLKMLFNTAIVILMGIGQIVVGAIIELYTAGIFTHVGAGFISEGVNDLFYAAGALTSGYFSWKDYKKHKIESVIMTTMTCAIGAFFSRAARSSRYGYKLAGPDYHFGSKVAEMSGTQLINTVGTKLVMKEVAKRIASKTIEGLAFGTANAVVDSFVENQLRDFCRNMASTILVNVKRKVEGHEISANLKEVYKTLGGNEAANLIDKLTVSAFSEKSCIQQFLPAVKTIASTVMQGIASAAEKRSTTSNPMQFPIHTVSKGMAFLERFIQVADMALATDSFLNHLNEEIKSELRKHADRDSADRKQEAEEDFERFRKEVIARWQELLSDKVGRMVEQNIVSPVLKAGVNSLVSYTGKKIQEMYRSYQESGNNKYYEKRTQEYREELEKAEQQQHGNTSEIKEQITDRYHKDMLKLLEKTRCPRLFAKLVRENIPMGMVCVGASVDYVTGFLRQQGINVPGITVVVTGEGGIRQTFSSAPAGTNAPIIHITLEDNHFRLSGSEASQTGRGGGSINDCLYQALAEAMPQLRAVSPDDFRNGAADRIERDPRLQDHIKQGWHVLPLRHGAVGGATSRRKRRKFRDESSSVDNELTKKVHVHISDRLTRVIRLIGKVQGIAEHTKLDRSEIVKAGASQSTDGSSGMGNEYHAAHVLRLVIGPKLKEFHGIYNELDDLLAHTQIVPRFANDWYGVGGRIDTFQGEILGILNSVNFNEKMTPETADKIKDVQKSYVNIINEERGKLEIKQTVSYERERQEQIDILSKAINDVNNISVEQLFKKGYRAYINEKSSKRKE